MRDIAGRNICCASHIAHFGILYSYSFTHIPSQTQTVGAQAPLGFYDPFNVVADDTAENFGKWREIELKHGRYVFVCA